MSFKNFMKGSLIQAGDCKKSKNMYKIQKIELIFSLIRA